MSKKAATMGIREARNELGRLVEEAHFQNAPTVLTHYGEPRAVLVSHAWYLRACQALNEEPGTATT
ncbi:type II toxin-antitoxin system prevent-host-death family antitoxin [Kitasatospora sp. NPDC085464]|uniref:type II toxin-antitoxin system prevent-host-death family antitoxin n=1 Tax=Kitasatospora sp. NPDC085464 TaxID=3364063 RepID=UPI0037C7257B